MKRVVPSKLSIQINEEKILNHMPEVFSFLKIKGNLSNKEMFSTFNMGIGFVIICNVEEYNKIKQLNKNIVQIGSIC